MNIIEVDKFWASNTWNMEEAQILKDELKKRAAKGSDKERDYLYRITQTILLYDDLKKLKTEQNITKSQFSEKIKMLNQKARDLNLHSSVFGEINLLLFPILEEERRMESQRRDERERQKEEIERNKEDKLLSKFKEILEMSRRVNISYVAKLLDLSERELFDYLYKWRSLGFKIDGDKVIVEEPNSIK